MNGSRNAPPTSLCRLGQELFAALISGASVVILADEISKGPARLAAAIGDHAVTRLSIVPSHLEALLGSRIAASLTGLRYCITAGSRYRKIWLTASKHYCRAHDC